jgi:hypothetical protein
MKTTLIIFAIMLVGLLLGYNMQTGISYWSFETTDYKIDL